EDRGERAEQRDAGEPDVARDSRLLADRHLAEHDREQVRADDEHHDAVQHADARRLAERVERDRPDPVDGAHAASVRSGAGASAVAIWRMNRSSSVSWRGVTAMTFA